MGSTTLDKYPDVWADRYVLSLCAYNSPANTIYISADFALYDRDWITYGIFISKDYVSSSAGLFPAVAQLSRTDLSIVLFVSTSVSNSLLLYYFTSIIVGYMKKNYLIVPLITLVVSLAGSWFTSLGMNRYSTLMLHPATPNGSVIGTVWTLIFIYTAIAALYALRELPRDKRFPLIIGLFIANAVLNLARSAIFFVGHRPLFALIEMIVLWLSVVALFILSYPKARLASRLLLPYMVRVLLASFFAYYVVIFN